MGLSDILSCVPSWLIYLLLFVGALYLYGIWPYLNNTIKLPGPKPMAFLGNLKDLSKKGPLATDTEYTKKYGPVHLTWMGRRPFIHIADPDMCRQILVKDFANFTNRPVAVPLSRYQKLFVSIIEDDHWKFIRSIISPAFSSGKMRGMVPLIQNCLTRLNERLSTNQKNGDSFNIQPVMEAVSLEVIGATAFGMDIDTDSADGKVFLEKAKKFFARNVFSSLPLIISQFFPMLIPVFEAVGWTVDIPESRDYFINVLTQAIKQRKNDLSGHKDLLTLMVTNNVDSLKETAEDADVDTDSLRIDSLRRDQKMTEDEVMAQSIIFLLAGFKTTSSAMSFLAYNLTVFTECQDKLVKEIDENLKGEVPTYQNVMNLPYLDMCLSETQRLYPAITGLFRMARNSTIINGQYIPGGANIKLLGYCLQRDPEYWPQPEKFDPERFSPEEKAKRNPYVYFPFGLGPRNCVGMRLAQLEAKMVMASILQKFRFVRTPETQVPLKYKATDHIESENGIWLKLEARDH